MIKQNGLLFSIENELENIRKIGSFDIEFNVNGDCTYLKPEVDLLVFRIIQETLKNSITHSLANKILFNIEYNEKYMCIHISDNGKGFFVKNIGIDEGKKMSSGISSMRKRAELINAEFEIESHLGKGTKTTIKIPIN